MQNSFLVFKAIIDVIRACGPR